MISNRRPDWIADDPLLSNQDLPDSSSSKLTGADSGETIPTLAAKGRRLRPIG